MLAQQIATICTKHAALIALAIAASGAGGADWRQGGNTFGALGVFGTNDAFDVSMRAGGVEKMRMRNGVGAVVLNVDGDLGDINGNEWISQVATATAVNFLQVANAATTGSPTITATGTDANVTLTIKTKGTGQMLLRPGADVAGAFQVQNAAATFALLSVGAPAGAPQIVTRATTSFGDANGNNWLQSGSAVASVNNIQITNAATGTNPIIAPVGTDAAVGILFNTKSTGAFVFTPGANSATAFQVTNAAGTGIVVVNSTAPGVTITGGLTQLTGAFSLLGNNSSSLVTTGVGSALTITSNATAVWSAAVGNLTLDAAATLNLGTTNASAIVLGNAANMASLTITGTAALVSTTGSAIAGGFAAPATLNGLVCTINGTARKILFCAT